MGRARLTVFLGDAGHKLGPGKIHLLEALAERGSISAAAREMGMAYRHAWEMVDELNRCFTTPVVEVVAGGRAGGGASLTRWGREVVDRFRQMEEATRRTTRRHLEAIEEQLAPAEPARRHSTRPRAKGDSTKPRG